MASRRAFLKAGGLTLLSASALGNTSFLNQSALAALTPAPSLRRKTLVMVFQRGGMDGVMAVAPFNDSALLKMRPTLRMSAARSEGEAALIDLDGRFALHPGFSSLVPLYKEGRLAIVHGIGSPHATRSHVEAQNFIETSTFGRPGLRSGWLNRTCGAMRRNATPFRAVAMTPLLPRAMQGVYPALTLSDIDELKSQAEIPAGQVRIKLARLLSKAEGLGGSPASGVEYPNTEFGRSMRRIAQLINANVGLEVAFAETAGWDTHVQQGTSGGQFDKCARDLSESVSAFWNDIEPFQDDVVLVTTTEFGRSVRENGSAGTDHGRASCSFIVGNSVEGGKVYGLVPELVPELLEGGRDLPVTTDVRSLFSEVAAKHLNLSADDVLFPGWACSRTSILRV